MDTKEFEERLDAYAERLSRTVSEGVRRLEETIERGKENLREDLRTERERIPRIERSPRLGLILLVGGFAWLLAVLGVFSRPILPVATMAVGAWMIVRGRHDRARSTEPPRDPSSPPS